MTLQRAICKSIRPYTWHSLLASLPLSVIVAIGIVWCWKEYSKRCCHSEDGFQRELCKLDQVSYKTTTTNSKESPSLKDISNKLLF